MERLIAIFLFFLAGTLSLSAQPFEVLSRQENALIVDAVRTADNAFDVARSPQASLNYPSAVLTGGPSGEVLAAWIRTDTDLRTIETARSTDGGRNWTREPFRADWDAEAFRSLSLFHLGRHSNTFLAENQRRRRTANRHNSLMIFSGGSPIVISSSYTSGRQWSNFYTANRFGGFRVSSLVRLTDGRLIALFHDDGRLLYHGEGAEEVVLRRSVIYKMYSEDGGLTWSEPQVALKHNLHGLYDAVAVYSPARRDGDLILIASQRETGAACVAFSSDDGESWSYPVELSDRIRGDRFGIATYKRRLLISYRDLCRTLADGTPNPTFGDIVLWRGSRHELLSGDHNGVKVRIADNFPTDQPIDYEDLKYTDCGYASVLPLAHNRISIVAYGRWEADELPFVRTFSLDPTELQRFIRAIE